MFSAKSSFETMLKQVQQVPKQAAFAFASALTEQARAIANELPGQMSSALDRPTAFTLRGVFFTRAQKDNLQAVVGIKDAQAEYLQWQVDGGVRAPTRQALKLPGDVQLDGYGNIPRSLIKQLVARAQAGRRATKSQQRRFGVSREVDLFYGEPGDGRPAGIYKRVRVNGDRGHLVPVVVFPKTSATYRQRFDFWGVCNQQALAELPGRLDDGLDRAMASAR